MLNQLAQLDGLVNALPMNQNLSLDRIKDLQDKRRDLDLKIANAREQLLKREEELKKEIKRDIASLQSQVNSAINS